jgi:hypothetical protein
MDTAWFAVDEDGHVAMFESGEAGAVPTDAYLGEDYYELVEKACKAAPRSTALLDLEGKKREHGSDHVDRHMLRHSAILCFLRNDEAHRELLVQARAKAMPSTSGPAVLFDKLDDAAFEQLHASGDCLGCFTHYEPDDDLRVAEHGIYQYNHASGNAIAGPYARAERPSTPAHIDRLPAEVREHAVKFPGKFAGAVSLQPAEVWSCDAWGPAWLASDQRTIRPFAGREQECVEMRAEMADTEGEYEWDAAISRPATPKKKPWWRFW